MPSPISADTLVICDECKGATRGVFSGKRLFSNKVFDEFVQCQRCRGAGVVPVSLLVAPLWRATGVRFTPVPCSGCGATHYVRDENLSHVKPESL